MKILVTGGAGFVGSIATYELVKSGYEVVVIDNLAQGHRKAVASPAVFIEQDLANEDALDAIFKEHRFDAVMHFAGDTIVGESMTNPRRYFEANLVAPMKLLNVMLKNNVKKIIFSSSSAVYGQAQQIPMTEDHPKLPCNSYGESKFLYERVLKWYYLAYGLKSISFRYFNAAGASENYGEDHNPETHLIPIVLQVALGKRDKIVVFGNDYPTEDGSCIRDYTHVVDIARAHILGLQKIDEFGFEAFNLGSGRGNSVLEVIDVAREVTGQAIAAETGARRPGDIPLMIADTSKAKSSLGWQPEYSQLKQVISSAWKWYKKNPNGYSE